MIRILLCIRVVPVSAANCIEWASQTLIIGTLSHDAGHDEDEADELRGQAKERLAGARPAGNELQQARPQRADDPLTAPLECKEVCA